MKRTHDDRWSDGTNKDTFWNLAVLLGGILVVIASVIDLPHVPSDLTHVVYSRMAVDR